MSYPVRKALKGRRAAVIGSGPGGLAAAAALAIRGARVVVLEKEETLCEGLQAQRQGEFRFDPWPPSITDPRIVAELFASAGLRFTDFVTLHRPDPLCRFILSGGEAVDFFIDPERTASQISRLEPRDGRRALAFLRRSRQIAQAFEHLRRALPEGAANAWSKPSTLFHARHMLSQRSYLSLVEKTFRGERTRQLLLGMRTLSGLAPGRAGTLAMEHLGAFLAGGGWYVEGGSDALRVALLRLCDLMNVRFVRRARVERLELQDGRVRRLHGTGFKPLAASIVVSNADIQHTFRDLLPAGESPHSSPPNPAKGLRRAHSSFFIRAGAARRWRQLRPLTIFPSENPREEARFLDRWRVPASQPTMAVADLSWPESNAAPEGKSALLIRVEMPAPSSRFSWTVAHAREIEQQIVAMLEERGLRGLRVSLAEEEALIPPEMDAAPSFDWGAGSTWRIETLRDLHRLPSNRCASVPGLYLAGPGAFPGPGLSNSILGGITAAVCAADDAR